MSITNLIESYNKVLEFIQTKDILGICQVIYQLHLDKKLTKQERDQLLKHFKENTEHLVPEYSAFYFFVGHKPPRIELINFLIEKLEEELLILQSNKTNTNE